MSEKNIYNKLFVHINNPFGVCGLMGNLYAESGLNSNNLQNTSNIKLGLTDDQYTTKVDNGTYTNFIKDSAGFGLAQWTWSTRKQNLLHYARSVNKSIGDEDMQIDFLIHELKTDFPNVYKSLTTAKSVKEASNVVLLEFEKPKDQSDKVKTLRASYGQGYYDKYVKPSNNQVKNIGGNIMTETQLRQNVISFMNKYLGITEGSVKHREILNIFNNSGLCKRYKMTVNDAWCATTVSAAFIANNLTDIFPCVECSCNKMIELAKAAGIWVENDAYIPSPGDVILYDWQDTGIGDNKGGADHVGIVKAVTGTNIVVSEGNYSNTVKERSLKINGKFIRGYITPNYAKKANATPITTNKPIVETKKEEVVNKVVTAKGRAKSFTKALAGTYTTTSNLYCRNDADKNSESLCIIPKGTSVKNYGYYTLTNGVKWLYVQFTLNGVQYTGFCSSSFLKK